MNSAETGALDDETSNTDDMHDVVETKEVEAPKDEEPPKDEELEELMSVIRKRGETRKEKLQNMEELGISVNLCAKSIYDVDNSAQTFSATFEFWVNRQLSKHELRLYVENPDDFKPKQLHFWPGKCVEVKEKELHKWTDGKTFFVGHDPESDSMILSQLWICNMVFSEKMELENFPFDVQHCEMGFHLDGRDIAWTPHSESKIYYRFKDNGWSDFRIYSTTLEGCDFENHGHQQITIGILEVEDFQGTVVDFQAIFALKRYWRFYARNVVLVLAIISFLSNMCFLFGDIDESVSDRFEFLSTIFLTVVAFIFITSEHIPRLNYMTFLDQYILLTMGYVMLIVTENVVLSLFDIADWDYYGFGVNLAIWVLVHIYLTVSAMTAYKKEMEKLGKFKQDIDGGWHPYRIRADLNGKHDKFHEEQNEAGLWRNYLRNGCDLE